MAGDHGCNCGVACRICNLSRSWCSVETGELCTSTTHRRLYHESASSGHPGLTASGLEQSGLEALTTQPRTLIVATLHARVVRPGRGTCRIARYQPSYCIVIIRARAASAARLGLGWRSAEAADRWTSGCQAPGVARRALVRPAKTLPSETQRASDAVAVTHAPPPFGARHNVERPIEMSLTM